MEKKKQLTELIKYLFFGVLTTVVGIGSFKLFDWLLGEKLYLISNVLSWIMAVSFAFITNKLWVFESKSFKKEVVFKEILSFAGARVFTLVIEELGLLLLISVLGMKNIAGFKIFGIDINGNLIAKIIISIIVVIINYIFSKFLIFKKKKGAKSEE